MFTGDESGNWLFRALWKAGFANQPESRNRSDGLRLSDCYLTATLRCAPPANKPLPDEIQNCSGFLLREIQLLANVQVVVGLGKIGFAAAVRAYRAAGRVRALPLPAFGHGAEYREAGLVFLASYHPSQQNTFTGRLTEPMLDTVFARAAHILKR
jgi:uracil-DNA glycosylase family 4